MTGTAPTGLSRARGATLLVVVSVLAGLLALPGCVAGATSPSAGSTTSASSTSAPATSVTTSSVPTAVGPNSSPAPGEDAQEAVDHLFAAALAGDQAGWDARVATSGTGFAERAALLRSNLRAMQPERLRVRLTGAEQAVSAARQAELGGTVRVVQAELSWRLADEDADARSSVWLTLVPGPSGLRLAGTDDGTTLDAPALPLWWLDPVTSATDGDVTVLVGPGQDARRWVGLAATAATDARRHLPKAQRGHWDGHLVVEVPGSDADFARVLGTAPTTYARTAAVTRPEGPTTDAAVRVVVNPATAGESEDELGTTLTHETVHVATASARSQAPLWAVEGLAEYVALEAHPDQRRTEQTALRSAPLPSRLPGDSAFTSGSKDVTAAYAQAWLACRAVATNRGRDDLGRLYAALDRGDSLGRATGETLGTTEPVLLGWWHAAMSQAAAGGGR